MAPFQLESALGLGVTELGVFASVVLFGVLIVQVYVYYICGADAAFVRWLVAAVFFLETCHTIAIVHGIYDWTIIQANVALKTGAVPGMNLAMLLETLVTFLVQGYFIIRVRRFTQNTYLAALLFALSLTRLAGGISLTVESFLNMPNGPEYFVMQDQIGWLVDATFGVGAAVDVSIAAALCVYLSPWKEEPVMKTTSQLVHEVMFRSIETGFVTSLVSLTVVVCFQTMKHNYIWVGFLVILSKLYSNTLLASLNYRVLRRVSDTAIGTISPAFCDYNDVH